LRVLIVDDDPVITHYVTEILKHREIEIRPSRGETACADAVLFKPDIVVLDPMLPGVDGREIARQLRARDVPIVVMSSSSEARIELESLGAKAYLEKPFSLGTLLRVMRDTATSAAH